MIEPPVYTDWGTWGQYSKCAPGHYVVGVQLRIEPDLGPDLSAMFDATMTSLRFYRESRCYIISHCLHVCQGSGDDDTALNAIRLTCSDGDVLQSAEDPWGDWLQYVGQGSIWMIKSSSDMVLAPLQLIVIFIEKSRIYRVFPSNKQKWNWKMDTSLGAIGAQDIFFSFNKLGVNFLWIREIWKMYISPSFSKRKKVQNYRFGIF